MDSRLRKYVQMKLIYMSQVWYVNHLSDELIVT